MSKTLDIYFQAVSFQLPSFVNESAIIIDPACPNPIAYRHMCRFQSKLIYEEPILMGLDYYWRLDDDSQILAPISYDVFAFMQQRQLLYGYVIEHYDVKQCIPCLWPAAKIYVSENNINATYFHNWSVGRMIYNNFEIASFSIWRNEKYTRFINYIDRVGGIYYYRWGDAPIKSIALSILVDISSVYRFQDISYRHQDYATYKVKPSYQVSQDTFYLIIHCKQPFKVNQFIRLCTRFQRCVDFSTSLWPTANTYSMLKNSFTLKICGHATGNPRRSAQGQHSRGKGGILACSKSLKLNFPFDAVSP